MEESHVIEYLTESGEMGVVNVIDIFTLDDYPGKEYIVYTNGDEKNPHSQIFVSELVEDEETFFLREIVDEKELQVVQRGILELAEGDGK